MVKKQNKKQIDNLDKENDSINVNYIDSFNSIIDNLSLLKLQISSIQQKIRCIEKEIKKDLKKVNKQNNSIKEKKQKLSEKKPSGFAKPIPVTKELCEFMNKPNGSDIARTEVTKALISYIEINNLKDKSKKTNIIPDDKLQNLLGISKEEIPDLNFFNIQKYMNRHFITNKNNIISSNISKIA